MCSVIRYTFYRKQISVSLRKNLCPVYQERGVGSWTSAAYSLVDETKFLKRNRMNGMTITRRRAAMTDIC